MEIDFTWLEEHFFKQRLDDKQRKLLSSKFEAVAYSAGSTIVEQGSMGQALYVIHSGSAHIDCHSNGEDVQIGTVHSGNLVGEMSFLTASEASATVRASTDCEIYRLSREAFINIMREDQELAFAVFAHLLTHTADVIRYMNAEKAAIQHYMSGSRF